MGKCRSCGAEGVEVRYAHGRFDICALCEAKMDALKAEKEYFEEQKRRLKGGKE